VAGKITREDLDDVGFVDAVELAATGGASSAYKSAVTAVSTTSGTKRVVISGFDVSIERDTPVQAGDKVVLAGNAAAGTYTINTIINATTFDVVEAIVTSTGGTVEFRYPAGAKKVGVDTTGFSSSGATTLQSLLTDLDSSISPGTNTDFLLDNEPPRPTTNYAITRSGNVVTKEEWKRIDTTLLKSIDYTRASGVITQEDRKVFATDGTTLLGHLRVIYTFGGGQVISAEYTRVV